MNINSLPTKFEQLKLIIENYPDFLFLVGTKLDSSFTTDQFVINGFAKPYRLDRYRNGRGVIIYIREDIPSKELNKQKFTKKLEGLFIEINLRKSKLLLFGTYHSTHPEYGLSDNDYFEQVRLALNVYSNYDKFLLSGDFNAEEEEEECCLKEFLYEYKAKNLIKQNTCFKSINNTSFIAIKMFKTLTLSTGLSDFHKMIVTVMKTTFPKAKPKIIQYRDYKNFIEDHTIQRL